MLEYFGCIDRLHFSISYRYNYDKIIVYISANISGHDIIAKYVGEL